MDLVDGMLNNRADVISVCVLSTFRTQACITNMQRKALQNLTNCATPHHAAHETRHSLPPPPHTPNPTHFLPINPQHAPQPPTFSSDLHSSIPVPA